MSRGPIASVITPRTGPVSRPSSMTKVLAPPRSSPAMIARWTGSPGVMPNGWSTYDIWQYSETGPFSGDSNVFGGSAAKLRDLAINPNYRPIGGKAPTTAPTTDSGKTIWRAAKT